MKIIKTVGVVGAGTMGSALAQKFAQENFNVILADRENNFVEKGIARIKTSLSEGIEKKVFTQEQADKIVSVITGTANLNDLKKCDLIIEAIFENFNAKKDLFQKLSEIVSVDTILATNTSSFSVTELSAFVTNPDRFIGLHYFYHAAKNRLVEIIPGEKTSTKTIETAKIFCIKSGKDAITCSDAYGFVVNRFFVPWLNEAVKLVEQKVATKEEIDVVCMKVFAIGMGPFALMNATGVPVAYHSEKTLEIFGAPYKTADLLKQQTELNKPWELVDTSLISIESAKEKVISERMLGVIFFVVSEIIDEEICSIADINHGARIGLQWKKGPIDMMKERGEQSVKQLIDNYISAYNNIQIPQSIGLRFWEIEYVTLEKKKDTAYITINRPKDLNALNEEVIAQLDEKFSMSEFDSEVKNIIITSSGKAFVAGADINFFVENIKNKHIENITSFTSFGQNVFKRIDNSSKKVITLLNGLAFGGGLELALCGDVILAVNSAKLAFPETGIGIYPALGGTFRASRRIGKGLAKYLICSGNVISAGDAEKIGLIDKAITIDELCEILTGNFSTKLFTEGSKKHFNGKYSVLEKLFDNFSIEKILNDKNAGNIPEEIVAEVQKKLNQKAPIALKVSETLVDNNSGDNEALEEISAIFSTNDALLGLTSIGKKIQFKGN
ncbi:MAG: Fatty acid oxidation complex subunit alpha [Bacteroidia bacterium]|nr:Fatty acid oxidation complex subunit alpha [Bacteroidia bacterium]